MFKKIISLSILFISIYLLINTSIKKATSWITYKDEKQSFSDSKRTLELEFPNLEIKRFIKLGGEDYIDDNFATLLPENTNNIVIAGHNRNHIFHFLHNVKIGDEVIYHKNKTEFYYQVTEILTVKPEEIQYLEETETNQLTLLTCTKNNKMRLVIICRQNIEKNTSIS